MKSLKKVFYAAGAGLLLACMMLTGVAKADTNSTSTCSVATSLTDMVYSPTPSVGDTITYTLNGEPALSTSTAVTVTDMLGAGLTFVSATPSIGTYASSTGIWNLGTLDDTAGLVSLSITATVNPGTEGQTIDNIPSVTYVQSNCSQTSAVTDAPITVQGTPIAPPITNPTSTPSSTTPVADLSIVKTANVTSTVEGATINYTLTVAALGPATSTGVVAADTLPSGLTFVNATSSVGSYASSTGTWTIGDLSASSTATLNIAATVNAGTAGTTIVNIATVGENASTTDPNVNNNSASVSVAVAPNSTSCVLTPAQFYADVQNGQIVVGSIVRAPGSASVSMTNHTNCSAPVSLSSYQVFVAPQGTGWLSTQQVISIATSTLGPNAVLSMSVPLASCTTQVDAWYGTAPSTLLDSNPYQYPNVPYTLAYADFGAPLCSAPTSTPSADLSINKTVDNATPAVGATINYTLTVAALGPATSTGVVATDTLPSGLTFENATASVGTYASSTGTWTIGDLSASSTATLNIAAMVNSNEAGQTITNTATVGESASTTDPNVNNNSSSVSVAVQPTVCTSNCGGGGGTPASSTLTVIVAGLNASDTASIAVNDITASGTFSTSTGNGSVPFVLKTNDQYAVTATSTGNYSEATSTGCSGTLVGNATCTVTFTAVASTTPSTDADISVVKTVDNANPAGGATVNYTVTVTALGPATSTFVTVQDQLPIGLSLVSATTSAGAYNMSTGAWTIGQLSPNAMATLQIAAAVSSAYDGQTITNTATVSQLSSLVDPNPANNSSSVSIAVQSAGGGEGCQIDCGGGGGGGGGGGNVSIAEMNVTKTVSNATPNVGDTITYTVKVSALGPANSVGVVANDILPSGLTFVSATSTEGTYNSSTGVWTIGQIIDGTSQTLSITATVNSGTDGDTITNTATISESASVDDPLTAGNTSSVSIVVGGTNGGGGGGGGGSVAVGGGGGGSVLGTSTSTTVTTGQVLGASASCGLYLDQYIHPIRKNLNSTAEVKKLQVFLNQNLGANLPVTGYYGPKTIAAVDQFQVKYNNEVLKPWVAYGLQTQYTPTDYVYKTTQRWINLIMCPPLNLPTPQLP